MLGKATNPLLQQTEQAIQQQVPANLQMPFQRSVAAGMTLLYSPALHQQMVQKLDTTPNPAENASLGAVNLTGTLLNQSKGQMPVSIAAPVAMILLCEILDFIAQAGKIQITPDIVAQAAHSVSEHMLAMLKISQNQLHQVVAHGMSGAQSKLNQAQPQGAAPNAAAAAAAAAPQPAAPPPSGGIISGAMSQGAQ